MGGAWRSVGHCEGRVRWCAQPLGCWPFAASLLSWFAYGVRPCTLLLPKCPLCCCFTFQAAFLHRRSDLWVQIEHWGGMADGDNWYHCLVLGLQRVSANDSLFVMKLTYSSWLNEFFLLFSRSIPLSPVLLSIKIRNSYAFNLSWRSFGFSLPSSMTLFFFFF